MMTGSVTPSAAWSEISWRQPTVDGAARSAVVLNPSRGVGQDHGRDFGLAS